MSGVGIRANGNGSKPWVNEHWESHPGVRSQHELSIGERAADFLKHWFGTWTAIGCVAAFIIFWWYTMSDPGHLNLNLMLSCAAAVQGIILQIAANRGDRISAEVAAHTHENTTHLISMHNEMLQLQRQQMQILDAIHSLSARVDSTQLHES